MTSTLQRPEHISHSSRETLGRCAKAYFLSRIAKAPQRPALWLAGGSAVHEATEDWDLLCLAGGLDDFDVKEVWNYHFDMQLAKAREKEENEFKWGRSKSEPIEVWRTMGLGFVQSYIDWRERSPWEIWTTPDGLPAIELDVSGHLPGCPVEIKGYVDRVFWDPVFKKLIVLDLKSGKKPPKNADQFGTYSALLKAKYGVAPDMGVAFMNRRAALGKPYDLTEYPPEYVGDVFGKAWQQVEAGNFPSNGFPGECFICDVQASCAAQNGPLAHLYDPASPGYPTPF